jgi:hypothetical protein
MSKGVPCCRGSRLDVDGFVLTQLASKLTAADEKPDSELLGLREHVRRALRLLVRLYHRHPILFLALFAAFPSIFVVLDFLPWTGHWLERVGTKHHATVSVLEHLSVSLLVGVGVITWWSRVKRREVLKDYRRDALDKPTDFVEWSRGETPVVRIAICKLLAAAIKSSEEPAVVVIQGRPGSGRTSCVVGLVRELAAQGLIPVPVRARRDGSFEPEDLARQTFRAYVDKTLSSDQPSEAVWYQATSMHDVVVLVDDLDDEIVDKLSSDGGRRFQKTISDLGKHQVAVLLATTGDLPLGNIKHVREDLDLFSREEATAYVHALLDRDQDRKAALEALEKLHQPVDHFLVAPFYVDLIVRLQKAAEKAGISLEDLHEQTDRWRADVLGKYLTAVCDGQIPLNAADLDPQELRERAREAMVAAEKVAEKVTIDDPKLTVARSSLDAGDRALGDAEDLNLLWRGGDRVGLAADDLGAYLLATRADGDVQRLFDDVDTIAKSTEAERPRQRRDRYVRSALIFWHLKHEQERDATFGELLTKLKGCSCVPTALVVAAIRIACACGLDAYSARVARLARACAESLNPAAGQAAEPWRAQELLGLVRALGVWARPEAHQLLWDLATNHNTEIEWWAAKALALAKGDPAGTLHDPICDVLEKADPKRTETSLPDDDVGNKVAVLAWMLPSLRDGVPGSWIEDRLDRLVEICTTPELSPLRGEMSLAQGLKLAIMNSTKLAKNVKLVHERNVKLVEDLLLDGGVRFWHARLVLVHALLAHAWEYRGRIDLVRSDLGKVAFKEEHLLVRRAIALADSGLDALVRAADGTRPDWSKYMWSHEREAVRWVEQGKHEVAQLAADVVLLSNMTYRLRRRGETEQERANAAALEPNLPRCIRRSSDRRRIDERCRCEHELCMRPAEPADRAVLATRARFSASFCRDQARLVAKHGAPTWIWTAKLRNKRLTYLRDKRLERFWYDQAGHVESLTVSSESDGKQTEDGATTPAETTAVSPTRAAR